MMRTVAEIGEAIQDVEEFLDVVEVEAWGSIRGSSRTPARSKNERPLRNLGPTIHDGFVDAVAAHVV